MAERKAVKYDASTVGTSGLQQYGGYVNEEFVKELRGNNAARVYREMADNDPTIGAMLFAITTLIRQVQWSFQSADDSPESEAAKQFAEEVLNDMSVSWSSVVAEICSMFTYGFAPMEIIWKKRDGTDARDGSRRSAYTDGRIGLRALSLRAQNTVNRWEIDPEDGSIDGLYQQPWQGPQVFIPIEKIVLFRTTEEKNNPEGRSVLRNAYRPWYFKKRIEEIEAVGIERDLAGLPIAYIPAQYLSSDADPMDKAVANEYKRLIRSIRRDQQEGLVLPSARDSSGNLMFDVKLLNAGGSRTFNTTEIIDRYDKRIAGSVLADFIFLGQGATGSFALSSDKTQLFATAVGAFTTSICDTFNRHLMPRLWKLNGMDVEYMPTLVAGDLEKPDLTALGEFITKLTTAGAPLFPDRELENHLRNAAGLPLAPEEGVDSELRSMSDQTDMAEMQGRIASATAQAEGEADQEE
jgi:hypothetical protein